MSFSQCLCWFAAVCSGGNDEQFKDDSHPSGGSKLTRTSTSSAGAWSTGHGLIWKDVSIMWAPFTNYIQLHIWGVLFVSSGSVLKFANIHNILIGDCRTSKHWICKSNQKSETRFHISHAIMQDKTIDIHQQVWRSRSHWNHLKSKLKLLKRPKFT